MLQANRATSNAASEADRMIEVVRRDALQIDQGRSRRGFVGNTCNVYVDVDRSFLKHHGGKGNRKQRERRAVAYIASLFVDINAIFTPELGLKLHLLGTKVLPSRCKPFQSPPLPAFRDSLLNTYDV